MHTRHFIKQERRKEEERPKERRGQDEGEREVWREWGGRKEEKEGKLKTYGFQCSFEIL